MTGDCEMGFAQSIAPSRRRLRARAGYSLVETMAALGVFGIVSLILASTVKYTGVMNVTADRQMEVGMMIFDASNQLTVPQFCNGLMSGMSLPVISATPSATPMVSPSPLVEISLTKGCVPQNTAAAPTPIATNNDPSQYTQAGICRGGLYANKINIDNVVMQNIQPLGNGSSVYSADVVISGTKVGAEMWGTRAVQKTLQFYFTFNQNTAQIVGCQGQVTADNSANCQMIGCYWQGSYCDCCTPLGGQPTPTPNPTQCIMPSSNCELPNGFAWQVGINSCSEPSEITIPAGNWVPIYDSSSPISKGQIDMACCAGNGNPIAACTAGGQLRVDSTSPGASVPTCTFPSCPVPTTWHAGANTCTSAPQTIAAGATTTVTATGGSAGCTAPIPCQASFYCPMINGGGNAALAEAECPIACPSQILSWTVGGNVCTGIIAATLAGSQSPVAGSGGGGVTGTAYYTCPASGAWAGSPDAAPAATCN